MTNQNLNDQELFNWLVLTINIGGHVHPKDSVRLAKEQLSDIKRQSYKLKHMHVKNDNAYDGDSSEEHSEQS